MSKYFKVAKPVGHPYRQMSTPEDWYELPVVEYEDVLVEVVDPSNRIADELDARTKITGYKPEYILLGWKVWLQLGWFASGCISVKQVAYFAGVKIVVDDYDADVVKALPKPKWPEVVLGGYNENL